MSPPIALSDDQLSTIMRAAATLAVADRDAFLRSVSFALAGREIGDGVVGRVCAEAQKRFFRPPEFAGHNHGGKHGR
jgi:hypothetical protein